MDVGVISLSDLLAGESGVGNELHNVFPHAGSLAGNPHGRRCALAGLGSVRRSLGIDCADKHGGGHLVAVFSGVADLAQPGERDHGNRNAAPLHGSRGERACRCTVHDPVDNKELPDLRNMDFYSRQPATRTTN